MKSKKIVLIIALTLLIATPPFIFLGGGTQSASASFTPSVVYGVPVGSTFTITLQISGVTSLWSWGLSLSWDPSILQMTSTNSVMEGSFLKSVGSTMFIVSPPNNTEGALESVSETLTQNAGASGSGSLANFTFTVVRSGICQINVTSSEFDSIDTSVTGVPPVPAIIPVLVPQVSFSTMATPNSAYGPMAEFSPADGSIFALGSTVPLDGSLSQPGYDTVNTSETCPITAYSWRVEYLNGTTFASLNGENTAFTASVEGAFRVVLIVTSVDPHPPSDSNFQTTGSTSKIIYVVSNPFGTKIDVYTDRGGVGVNSTGEAYSPLQTLRMYASVMYSNSSLSNQNVLFTIQNSNGSVIAVRQGITNQTGVAFSEFTLPIPDPNSNQTSFGTWRITAAVNVTGVTVTDTTTFAFNYLSYLSGVQKVQVPTSVHRLENLPIQLTLDNSYFPNPWTQVSISVFDQANVPIGSSTILTSQTQVITIISADITIPSWAFTGQATIYICLLTNSSNSKAVPLSPEASATFNITE